MATKPIRSFEEKEVTYTTERWDKLTALRKKAIYVMACLEVFFLQPVVHGSIARGDVKATSDVDVFIAEPINSLWVQLALEDAKIPINRRLVVQATPNYAMKAHLEIDDVVSVTFPLMQMRTVEREFYRFGGEATRDQLIKGVRVPGVDKRLMLIEPTDKGHIESSIIGREENTAKTLGVSTQTVLDRVHALSRRDSVGRTGVFIKKELTQDETFELTLKKLSESNPAVRRRMKKDV